MEESASSPLAARWWKQRYFVEDGLIRPVVGSKREMYDPLEAYFQRHLWRINPPLHLALARLNPLDDEQVERFCSTWGLLGLFQHPLLQVTYVPGSKGGALPRHNPPQHFTEVVETPLFRLERPARDGTGRLQRMASAIRGSGPSADEQSRDQDEELARQLAAAELQDWWEDPTWGGEAIVLRDGQPQRLELVQHFVHYFPAASLPVFEIKGADLLWSDPKMLPEFPTWSSTWLWDELCEPLEEFRDAVNEFKNLSQISASVKSMKRVDRTRVELLESRFNGHLAQTGLRLCYEGRWSVDPGTQSWKREYFCPSLLSTAYLQLMLAFTGETPLRFCESISCRKAFEAERPRQRFCSRVCQKSQQQRRRRANAPSSNGDAPHSQ